VWVEVSGRRGAGCGVRSAGYGVRVCGVPEALDPEP
jgi:hypothetical protein